MPVTDDAKPTLQETEQIIREALDIYDAGKYFPNDYTIRHRGRLRIKHRQMQRQHELHAEVRKMAGFTDYIRRQMRMPGFARLVFTSEPEPGTVGSVLDSRAGPNKAEYVLTVPKAEGKDAEVLNIRTYHEIKKLRGCCKGVISDAGWQIRTYNKYWYDAALRLLIRRGYLISPPRD